MPRPLLPVDEALARVLADARPLGAEASTLADALGRVLAAAPAALRSQPPFSASAMDGYAVRAAEAREGAILRVIGQSAAGHGFGAALDAGEAVRIFTGAPVPDGADAILIQENTEVVDDGVRVVEGTSVGRHVRSIGIDFRDGDVPLAAGGILSPRALGLIASMGHAEVAVGLRPRVGVLATGDELVLPGAVPGPDQIIASSAVAIAALVRAEGAIPVDLGIVTDDLASLDRALARAAAAEVDVLVTLGGASVGDHDLVRAALDKAGIALDFWQIAMRPGKPMMYGRREGLHVLGLPGNPVSTHVCAILFLLPLLRRLLGRAEIHNVLEDAVCGAPLRDNDRRQDYLRADLSRRGADLVATPFPSQDSSLSRPLALAGCLLIRPPFAPAAAAGAPCRIIRLGASV